MLVRNTIANYLGQGYTILVAVLVTPMFLGILGPEEFGLIGFFTLFSSWLQLLTTGLNPTLARQIALFHGRNGLTSAEFRTILRSLELAVLALSLLTAAIVWIASEWIAGSWLNITHLSIGTVSNAVAAMGMVAALRWFVSLYSSGLSGLEHQVWLNGFNIAIATMRNIGGLLLVIKLPDISVYFLYQVILSLTEVLVIGWAFYRRLPRYANANDPGLRFSITVLRPLLPFILATTYSAILWVFITQFDKLIMSTLLSLKLFGYFSFIILLATAARRVSDPINHALLPRLTRFTGVGKHAEASRIYSLSAQLLAVFSFSTTGVIAFFPSQSLMLLTGNAALAEYGANFLPWFVLGNGILALSTVQYMLQVAHGRLRLHLINTTLTAVIQVPVLTFVAINYGPIGVGMAWFVFRLIIFAIMSPIVHLVFHQGPYLPWLKERIVSPLLGTGLTLASCWLVDFILLNSIEWSSRVSLAMIIGLFGMLAITGGIICAPDVKSLVLNVLRRQKTM